MKHYQSSQLSLKTIFLCLLSILLLFIYGCNLIKNDDKNHTAVTSEQSVNIGDNPETQFIDEPLLDLSQSTKSVPETTSKPSKELKREINPNNSTFVKIKDYIPSIHIELKYATKDNFTGRVIYTFSEAYLRYGTVNKLINVQNELKELGYSLVIWDAYRPVESQYKLWQVVPNPRYVANPNTGYSSHSKGNTVDVTLMTVEGLELNMPSEFDNFSSLADRDYSDVEPAMAKDAKLLEEIMVKSGFNGYSKEWWHFSDTVSYPVEKNFIP